MRCVYREQNTSKSSREFWVPPTERRGGAGRPAAAAGGGTRARKHSRL